MREGVQGFGRAALAGGIPCLLASKWSVPTNESVILITRIYAFMAENKVRKRQPYEGFFKKREGGGGGGPR